MAVLKYKSKDGTIKTLALAAGGVAGVSSVNGKTGDVIGVYMSDNPPPYPVTSVDGKTGSITSVISISGPESAENGEYSITVPPRTCCILMNVLKPFTTHETTLPAGNEDGITLVGDGFYPGELIAGYFNRGYIMCKESYLNATTSIFTYKNFGSSAYYLKYGFNILLVNGRSYDSRLTIKGYY